MAEQSGNKEWFRRVIDRTIDPREVVELIKEFTTIQNDENKIDYLVTELENRKVELDFTTPRTKNNDDAKRYRLEGNSISTGSSCHTNTVMQLYMKSIAYAPLNSVQLALTYANRSVLLFNAKRYADCLDDIERALDANYPQGITAKLYARRVKCLIALERSSEEIEVSVEDTRRALEKIDMRSEESHFIEEVIKDAYNTSPPPVQPNSSEPCTQQPNMNFDVYDENCQISHATGIEIHWSSEYGRYIVASKNIKPGEVIANIDAYVKMLNSDVSYDTCGYCLCTIDVGIACNYCVNQVYCSSACRDAAWNDYHEFECPIIMNIAELQVRHYLLLAIRTTLKGMKEAGGIFKFYQMIQDIEAVRDKRVLGFTGKVLDCTKYAAIYAAIYESKNKVDRSDEFRTTLLSILAVYYLATRTKALGILFHPSLQIFRACGILNFLAVLIIKTFHVEVHFALIGRLHRVPILPTTIPLCGLFRHSCDSNTYMFSHGSKTILVSNYPIKKGEFISIKAPSLHYTTCPLDDRKYHIMNYYQMVCECSACSEQWSMFHELSRLENLTYVPQKIKNRIKNLNESIMCRWNGGQTDLLAQKKDLCYLIELRHQYARPSKDLVLNIRLLNHTLLALYKRSHFVGKDFFLPMIFT